MRVMVQVTKTLAMSLILESKNIQIVIKRICEPISPSPKYGVLPNNYFVA